jgi:hypothetical protein
MSAPMATPPSPLASGSTDPEPPQSNLLWLRLAGLAVACLGAVLVAVVGAFLTPFRIGTVLVPVSLLIVIGGLTAVIRFAYAVTEKVGLSLIPGIVWLVLSLVLSARTREGDLVLLQQNWVAVVYILVGSVTVGVLAFRMIVPRR